MDDANVDFPAGVADANFNVMHAKMFKDGSNPGVNSSPNSKKTMEVDIMKQGSSGAISKKVVENLAVKYHTHYTFYNLFFLIFLERYIYYRTH